jgi:hypothetical protein
MGEKALWWKSKSLHKSQVKVTSGTSGSVRVVEIIG